MNQFLTEFLSCLRQSVELAGLPKLKQLDVTYCRYVYKVENYCVASLNWVFRGKIKSAQLCSQYQDFRKDSVELYKRDTSISTQTILKRFETQRKKKMFRHRIKSQGPFTLYLDSTFRFSEDLNKLFANRYFL